MREKIKQAMRFWNYECCVMQSHVKPASGAEGRNNATSTEISTQKNYGKGISQKNIFSKPRLRFSPISPHSQNGVFLRLVAQFRFCVPLMLAMGLGHHSSMQTHRNRDNRCWWPNLASNKLGQAKPQTRVSTPPPAATEWRFACEIENRSLY